MKFRVPEKAISKQTKSTAILKSAGPSMTKKKKKLMKLEAQY